MKAERQAEQRWSRRQPLSHDLALYSEGRLFPGRVGNISVGGLFVETDVMPLAPNALVYVLFDTEPDEESPRQCFAAQVVWTDSHGAGLMFTDFSPTTLCALRRIVDDTGRTSASGRARRIWSHRRVGRTQRRTT